MDTMLSIDIVYASEQYFAVGRTLDALFNDNVADLPAFHVDRSFGDHSLAAKHALVFDIQLFGFRGGNQVTILLANKIFLGQTGLFG